MWKKSKKKSLKLFPLTRKSKLLIQPKKEKKKDSKSNTLNTNYSKEQIGTSKKAE